MPDATIRTVAAIGGTLDAQGNLHQLPDSSGAATGIAAAAGGVLYVANGEVTALSPVNTSPMPPAPAIFASNIWSAAGFFHSYAGVVAPGEFLSVNGTGMGPVAGVTASPSGGAIGTSLAGVRDRFRWRNRHPAFSTLPCLHRVPHDKAAWKTITKPGIGSRKFRLRPRHGRPIRRYSAGVRVF
jgi:hypothetical protein